MLYPALLHVKLASGCETIDFREILAGFDETVVVTEDNKHLLSTIALVKNFDVAIWMTKSNTSWECTCGQREIFLVSACGNCGNELSDKQKMDVVTRDHVDTFDD